MSRGTPSYRQLVDNYSKKRINRYSLDLSHIKIKGNNCNEHSKKLGETRFVTVCLKSRAIEMKTNI